MRRSILAVLAILLGTPTSVLAAAAGPVCIPPRHQECDLNGQNCRCVIISVPAKSGAANPAGGTTPPRRVKGTTNPPLSGTQQK